MLSEQEELIADLRARLAHMEAERDQARSRVAAGLALLNQWDREDADLRRPGDTPLVMFTELRAVLAGYGLTPTQKTPAYLAQMRADTDPSG